jgi:hypothetical protein
LCPSPRNRLKHDFSALPGGILARWLCRERPPWRSVAWRCGVPAKFGLRNGTEAVPYSVFVQFLSAAQSGHGYALIQVDILNLVQQFDAVFHRPLEGFAAADQVRAACSFVDHRGTRLFRSVDMNTRSMKSRPGQNQLLLRHRPAAMLKQILAFVAQ